MENKEEFAIGYAIAPNSEESNEGMDNFMYRMVALMLLAIFGTFGGTHPEEPEKNE